MTEPTIFENNGLMQITIQTIGTLHPGALALVEDGLYFDLGNQLRNPFDDPAMRDKTGLDREVSDHVLSTPGAMEWIERIAESAKAVLLGYANSRRRLVHVTVACKGGRHRSVALAEAAADYLRLDDIAVQVDHRHIDRPVVLDKVPHYDFVGMPKDRMKAEADRLMELALACDETTEYHRYKAISAQREYLVRTWIHTHRTDSTEG